VSDLRGYPTSLERGDLVLQLGILLFIKNILLPAEVFSGAIPSDMKLFVSFKGLPSVNDGELQERVNKFVDMNISSDV
jgi:hypothetical protein